MLIIVYEMGFIKDYKVAVFKRLTGVSIDTFMVMINQGNRLVPKSTYKIKGVKRSPKH